MGGERAVGKNRDASSLLARPPFALAHPPGFPDRRSFGRSYANIVRRSCSCHCTSVSCFLVRLLNRVLDQGATKPCREGNQRPPTNRRAPHARAKVDDRSCGSNKPLLKTRRQSVNPLTIQQQRSKAAGADTRNTGAGRARKEEGRSRLILVEQRPLATERSRDHKQAMAAPPVSPSGYPGGLTASGSATSLVAGPSGSASLLSNSATSGNGGAGGSTLSMRRPTAGSFTGSAEAGQGAGASAGAGAGGRGNRNTNRYSVTALYSMAAEQDVEVEDDLARGEYVPAACCRCSMKGVLTERLRECPPANSSKAPARAQGAHLNAEQEELRARAGCAVPRQPHRAPHRESHGTG